MQHRMLQTQLAGAGDHGNEHIAIATFCELVQAAPRLAQLMAAPGGALRELVELASVAEGADDELPLGHRSVYTTLRIVHSFARALPDPQARDPPKTAVHSNRKAKQPLVCVRTLRTRYTLGEHARQSACPKLPKQAQLAQASTVCNRTNCSLSNLWGVRRCRLHWRLRRN